MADDTIANHHLIQSDANATAISRIAAGRQNHGVGASCLIASVLEKVRDETHCKIIKAHARSKTVCQCQCWGNSQC